MLRVSKTNRVRERVSSVAKPPGPAPMVEGLEGRRLCSAVTHTFTALIDGRSDLIIKGNTARWQHFDYYAPGLFPGQTQPTVIDGKSWAPTWPQGTKKGSYSSTYTGVSPAFPTAGSYTVSLTDVTVRESAKIIQQPTAANQETTIVEFNDDLQAGPADYTIKLSYTQPVIKTGVIRGTVFNDWNADKKIDEGELGLGGYTVFIDQKGTGKFVAGDPTVVTKIDGSWSFSGLAAGTYKISVEPVNFAVETTPAVLTVTIQAGGVSSNNLFGEKAPG